MFSELCDNTNPRSLATTLRARRSIHIRRLVEQAIAENDHCTIVDLGGTENYWRRLDWLTSVEDRIAVTLVNMDDADGTGAPPFRHVRGDATDPALLREQSFDICHSNSVIEHVGNLSRKKAFAANVARLGRAYVVQTPNYWFPIEPHFFCPLIHWLPKPLQIFLLMHLSLGWSHRPNTLDEAIERLESIDLLTIKLFRSLFPDATIVRERIVFMTKSFMAIREFQATRV